MKTEKLPDMDTSMHDAGSPVSTTASPEEFVTVARSFRRDTQPPPDREYCCKKPYRIHCVRACPHGDDHLGVELGRDGPLAQSCSRRPPCTLCSGTDAMETPRPSRAGRKQSGRHGSPSRRVRHQDFENNSHSRVMFLIVQRGERGIADAAIPERPGSTGSGPYRCNATRMRRFETHPTCLEALTSFGGRLFGKDLCPRMTR